MFKVLFITPPSPLIKKIITSKTTGLKDFTFYHTVIPTTQSFQITIHSPHIVVVDLDLVTIPICQIVNSFTIQNTTPLLIGLTSCYQKAFHSLKHQFFDTLIKPATFNQLSSTLHLCKKHLIKPNQSIIISSPKEIRYLSTLEIKFLKADNNYVAINLNNAVTFTVFNTLKYFQNTLPLPFLRVHKSYIINPYYVIKINHSRKFLYLKDCNTFIPFTVKYKKEINLIDSLKKEKIFELPLL